MKEMPLHENAIISNLQHSEEQPMPHYAECDELTFEKITRFDAEEIFEVFNTARKDSFTYCGWDHMETLDDAHEFLEKRDELWDDDFKFSYGVCKDGELVGVTYARFDPCATQDVVVLGLWLHDDWWGQGISGERADVLLHLVFTILGVDRIRVGCLEPNEQSLKAIEKYMERYYGLFYGAPPAASSQYSDMEQELIPHYEFTITYKDFRSGQTGIQSSLPNHTYDELLHED